MPTINKKEKAQSSNATTQNANTKDSNVRPVIIEDPMLTYTRWIMIFTGALVFCNILMWLATKKSADAAQKAADAAMKSAKSLPTVERAYLFVNNIEWLSEDVASQLNKRNGTKVQIEIINVGKTPAILQEATASIFIKEQFPPIAIKDIDKPIILAIPDGGVIVKSDGKHTMETHDPIDKQEFESMNVEIMCFYCCGMISYKDVFGKTHETGFCYEWTPRRRSNKFRISDNKELNYYT